MLAIGLTLGFMVLRGCSDYTAYRVTCWIVDRYWP